MNKIYGSFIFFFYFVKYPIVIYLTVSYFYLNFPQNIVMHILGVISIILILKDWISLYIKPKKSSGINK
ncbi:MAG: hypothetical protein C0626_11880 [Arcobacter sp.]|nr:MAG: hypothetical protein C0626_11880 [Arcobacter sp.]